MPPTRREGVAVCSGAMYRVYLLQNSAGRRYIGLSSDVELRLKQHNTGLSTWTRNKGPWRKVWQSILLPLGETRRLELDLKRQKGGGGIDRLLSRWRDGS